MTMERVLEGVDASRRVAWAQKYAADQRIAELEDENRNLSDQLQRAQSEERRRKRLLDQCLPECHEHRWAERTRKWRDQVIKLMSDGRPRSRAAIADALGGNRHAAWKAINQLWEDGVVVPVSDESGSRRMFIYMDGAE